MSHSIVGKIVSGIVLVVLFFILGSEAAENAKMSLVLVAGLVGAVMMLVLGARSWMLLFLLPPLLTVLPLPGGFREIGKPFLVAAVILPYWIFMWCMGYAKMRWRSVWVLDLLAFLSFALMIAAYIRRPVSVLALGLDTDTVGGRPYIVAAGALIYYVALSSIDLKTKKLGKVLHWHIWVALVCGIIGALQGLSGAGETAGEEMSMAESIAETRFFAFSELGSRLIVTLFAYFPLLRFLTNPLLMIGMIGAYAMIMISGFRSSFILNTIAIIFMSAAKREFLQLLLLGVAFYMGLLMLGTGGGLNILPYGVQRTLSFLPGVQVSAAAASDAQGSADWRYEMWGWALDQRTGFIRDYVWGDGVGLSKSEWMRDQRAMMRGELRYGDQDQFARSGQWHSLIISTIQGLGYVGLVVMLVMIYYVSYLIIRTCFALRGTPLFVPAMVMLMPFTPNVLFVYVNAGDLSGYFTSFIIFAQAKLLFCIAREWGLIIPWSQRRRYVPLMIEQHGKQLQQG